MGVRYYKVHGGRLSFAEYWRMSPDPLSFLVAAGLKLVGGMNFTFSIPRIDDLVELDWADLPGVARRALADPRDRFEAAGLRFAFAHELPLLEPHRVAAGAVFLAPDGRAFAAANFAKEEAAHKVVVAAVSRFGDGRFGITTGAEKKLEPRPNRIVRRYVGLPADALYARTGTTWTSGRRTATGRRR